jgi:hypothetical protein
LRIEHQEAPEGIVLTVDALADHHSWYQEHTLAARITDPAGRTKLLNLPQIAPGRYQITFQPMLSGRYDILLTRGEDNTRYALYHESMSEFRPANLNTSVLEHSLQRGDVLRWSPEKHLAMVASRKATAASRRPNLSVDLGAGTADSPSKN